MSNPELTQSAETTQYPIIHEIANSVTHGIGAGLSVVALFMLVLRAAMFAPDNMKTTAIFSFMVFGISLIILYSSSTLYHAVWNTGLKRSLCVVDHSAIYILIAGSYTAFALNLIPGTVGWILVGVNWGLAIFGTIIYAIFREKSQQISLCLYLFMGWLIVFAIRPLLASAELQTILLLSAGGFSYTFGCYFFVKKNCWWAHPVWHLFVLGGSFLQFLAAYWIY